MVTSWRRPLLRSPADFITGRGDGGGGGECGGGGGGVELPPPVGGPPRQSTRRLRGGAAAVEPLPEEHLGREDERSEQAPNCEPQKEAADVSAERVGVAVGEQHSGGGAAAAPVTPAYAWSPAPSPISDPPPPPPPSTTLPSPSLSTQAEGKPRYWLHVGGGQSENVQLAPSYAQHLRFQSNTASLYNSQTRVSRSFILRGESKKEHIRVTSLKPHSSAVRGTFMELFCAAWSGVTRSSNSVCSHGRTMKAAFPYT